eukprot:1333872-Rhodomonas_salina.1
MSRRVAAPQPGRCSAPRAWAPARGPNSNCTWPPCAGSCPASQPTLTAYPRSCPRPDAASAPPPPPRRL